MTRPRFLIRTAIAACALTAGSVTAADAQGLITSVSAGCGLVHALGVHDRHAGVTGAIEFVNGPVTLGGEVGFTHLPETTRTYAGGSSSSPGVSLAVTSFRASYYPVRFAGSRLRPFVTGGMSLYPGNAIATLDAGGGFDWWASRQAGIRIEVRESFTTFFSLRIGVVLR
jgi:hypothetical protein